MYNIWKAIVFFIEMEAIVSRTFGGHQPRLRAIVVMNAKNGKTLPRVSIVCGNDSVHTLSISHQLSINSFNIKSKKITISR